MDNTVANGIATAKASYDGFFVAPRAAWTQPFAVAGQKVEAKFSAQYAALMLGSYAETGSNANLTMDSRTVQVFIGRAGIAVPFEQVTDDGSRARLIPSLGVEERTQFGASLVTGTLAGSGITFDASNGNRVGGYGGLRLERDIGCVTLFAESEGLWEDSGSTRVFANGGIKVRF